MVVVLIPSYKPDEGLITLLEQLTAQGRYAGIVVVDDGGGAEYSSYFDRAASMEGVFVTHHAVNLGKGRALKTGINEIMQRYPGAHVVTADSDGQHTPRDIARVADALEASDSSTIVLGKRVFGKGTPLKSLLGNTITRWVFALSTGKKVYDTQTGLRGLPAELLPEMMRIPGERYEYEMNMLLQAPRDGAEFSEIEIETVYINNNAGSHFNPVRDALRVFSRVLAYAASSMLSFAVDYFCYAVLIELVHLQPELAFIGARAVSSVVNFSLNRNMVFGAQKGSWWKQALGYYALVVVIAVTGSLLVDLGTSAPIHLNEYIVKIIVDVMLSVVSFFVQRVLIFRPIRKKKA